MRLKNWQHQTAFYERVEGLNLHGLHFKNEPLVLQLRVYFATEKHGKTRQYSVAFNVIKSNFLFTNTEQEVIVKWKMYNNIGPISNK